VSSGFPKSPRPRTRLQISQYRSQDQSKHTTPILGSYVGWVQLVFRELLLIGRIELVASGRFTPTAAPPSRRGGRRGAPGATRRRAPGWPRSRAAGRAQSRRRAGAGSDRQSSGTATGMPVAETAPKGLSWNNRCTLLLAIRPAG